jgi:hypothetical protein
MERLVARSAVRGRAAKRLGFVLAACAYFLIGLRPPHAWSHAAWILLVFLVVPAGIGALIGRRMGEATSAPARFRAGFAACSMAMALYAAISMFVIRAGIGSGSPDALLVVIFVALVFAVGAGAVGGAVSMLSTGLRRGDPAADSSAAR